MPQIIRDGKGTGYNLQVDDENRAQTAATTLNEFAHESQKHGTAFALTLGGPLTLASAGVWHHVWSLKNTDASKVLVISYVDFSWDGGSTTNNKVLWYRQTALYTLTGNYTATTPGKFNFGSSQVADLEHYVWDGVGTGMIDTGRVSVGSFAIPKGTHNQELHGAPVLLTNNYAGIEVMSEEVGSFGINAGIYFKDNPYSPG